MDTENKDVESLESDALYEELNKTLKDSEAEEASVASDQKPKEDDNSKKEVNENAELSEDDIAKLTPRAQKRIREQAEEIKRLSEAAKVEEPKAPDTTAELPKFKTMQEFLDAVEDKPSRTLLEKFAETLRGETSQILAPIEQKNNETKFETEFNKYEKIEGLVDYKNDLRKTFLRNPNQSLKALIGEVVTDLQLNKVKPVEKTPSTPSREKPNTENLSKDQLYDLLDTMRE